MTLDEDTIFVGQNGRICEAQRTTSNDAFVVPAEIASPVSTGREETDMAPTAARYMTTRSK